MQSPLISVIIPSFNAAKSIRQTLLSLLKQQFTAFEVIIMDGASNDQTVPIVQELAGRDPRVRFFSEKDKGIYDAMNKGIQAARGEWLYFLGADDELLDASVFQQISQVLQKTGALFVYGNVLFGAAKHWYDGPFDYEKLLHANISHQAIFYHRKVFSIVGGFDIQYRTHADWAFNINCFKHREIAIEYANLLVARFGMEGASSRHDVIFLRGFLLPEWLRHIYHAGIRTIRNVKVYDEWWRLIRNAGIRNHQQLLQFAGELQVPAPVLSMVAWQSMVAASWLKAGMISKGLMLLNYLFNRFTGKL